MYARPQTSVKTSLGTPKADTVRRGDVDLGSARRERLQRTRGLNGDPSVPGGLTVRGREQAHRLGTSIADDPIDLCVTTAFERTRETAEIALAGRDVPRIVVPELDDPSNGDFELRPYIELATWREANGPDIPLPSTDRSERQMVTAMLPGLELLIARPELTLLNRSRLVRGLGPRRCASR